MFSSILETISISILTTIASTKNLGVNIVTPQIIIPKLSLTLPIYEKTSAEVLDLNVVGILDGFNNIDTFGHTILAGHNFKNVFGDIDKLELEDEIIIKANQIEKYYVKEKHIIKDDDMSHFRNSNEKKLTLITCTSKPGFRLLVVAYFT